MPAKKLETYLDSNNIHYVKIKHSPAYTAHQVAQSAHIAGKDLAKTVIIKLPDGKMAMVIITANDKINFDHLEKSLGAGSVQLASEREFQDKFPGCEVGAMPPFGNLYDMDVYVDNKITHDEEIAFNAGNHSEVIKLAYGDFSKLVKPNVLDAI